MYVLRIFYLLLYLRHCIGAFTHLLVLSFYKAVPQGGPPCGLRYLSVNAWSATYILLNRKRKDMECNSVVFPVLPSFAAESSKYISSLSDYVCH